MTPTRTMIAAATIALAFSAPAAATTPEGDPARGAIAYEVSCAECHANVGRLVRRLDGDDEAEKARNLEAFLPMHYAEDDQERADIIAFLLAQ